MRKVVLMLLLAAVSGSATAKWVRVAGSQTNTTYADSATIRKAGATAKMWSLFDYKAGAVLDNGTPYRSTRAQFEYDCMGDRMRPLAVSFHAERMARGEIIHSTFDPGDWGPVPPGTVNASLWKIACRKR